jgi:hypothetical protein
MGAMKSKIKVSVLTVGLDNSGKTTVLNKMNPQKVRTLAAFAPTCESHPSFARLTIIKGCSGGDRRNADGGLQRGGIYEKELSFHMH